MSSPSEGPPPPPPAPSNVGLHPSDPERLIVIRGGPRFFRRLAGLALLFGGSACAAAVARDILCSPRVPVAALLGAFVLMLFGGILVFGRTHAVVDRRAKLLRFDRYLWLFRLCAPNGRWRTSSAC